VIDQERLYRDVLVLIHDAWADLMDVNLVPTVVVLGEVLSRGV
jgi:hypothetical protein